MAEAGKPSIFALGLQEIVDLSAGTVVMGGSTLTLTYTPSTGVGPRTLQRYFGLLLPPGTDAKVLREEKITEDGYERVEKELNGKKTRFYIAFLLTLPVFLFSMILPMLFPTFLLPLTTPFYNGLAPLDLILLLFATPVQLCCGWVFYKGAYKSVLSKSLGMDMLVVVGTTASYGYGISSISSSLLSPVRSGGSEFLETSCVLLTFVLMGK
ncbi:hypothetical protein TrRE_jg9718, partial [Triparma retinervis]